MKRLIIKNLNVKPKKFRTVNQSTAKESAGMNDQKKAPQTVSETEEWFRRELTGNADIVFRDLLIGGSENLEAVLIYMYGNTNKDLLNTNVIKQLMTFRVKDELSFGSAEFVKKIADSCISIGRVKIVTDKNSAKNAIFEGNAVLIIDRFSQLIVLEAAETESRQISEPENEKTIRGPKEGFIEDIWTNIALIRRTLKDPTLKVEIFKIGRRTKTNLALIYIDSLADLNLVSEVRKRVEKIDIDGALANGYIEDYIEDNPYSPFPQTLGTEKPDKVNAALLEGRIVIILDGTPFVMLVPAQFIQFFQAPEDYYDRPIMGTYIRILRVLAFIVTTTAAPAYVALTSFHLELVPFELLLNIAELRKQVPFPPVAEVFTMEFIIESLRESGLRLPGNVATTLGVVGGIILGDAAVKSNLVSPSMIIIITISIICNFVIPNYGMSLVIRILRLFLIILAASFGAFGITLGWLIIIIHLCRLESFGLPYFAPLAPTRFADFKDLFIRVPIWAMKQRPDSIPVKDKKGVINNREQKRNGK